MPEHATMPNMGGVAVPQEHSAKTNAAAAQAVQETNRDRLSPIPSTNVSSQGQSIEKRTAETAARVESTTAEIARRRARRDTVSILLDELRKAKPTAESFVSVDRTLPPPPSPASIIESLKISQEVFAKQEQHTEEVATSRKQLLDALCRFTTIEQQRSIAEQMQEFETRLFKNSAIQAEPEIYASYKDLCKILMTDPAERTLPWQSRLLAVSHFLIHAAQPDSICQGSKIGAQIFCLMQKLISNRPSRLAEILSSAALTGEWHAFDGKLIKADEHSLKPGPEELMFKAGDHKRSYAAKIWQIFMLNNCLIRRTVPMFYSETPGRPGKDYGGQILRTSDGQPINPKLGASVSFFELALLSRFEFGENSCILVNDLSFPAQSAELKDLEAQNMLVHFKSAAELSDILAQCKAEGRLPAVVAVDERRLLAESYQDGINHAVNIVDFNEFGALRVFNPILLPGMQRTARLTLQRLYNATLSNFRV